MASFLDAFEKKNSPRLIDYIVFAGRRHPCRNEHFISQPELLRVYPPKNHTDYPLPNDIVYFCQPEGCYNTLSKSFAHDPSHPGGYLPKNLKMEFFSFMLTDKESNVVRFGVCLNFLRPIGRRKSSYTAGVTRRRITSFRSAIHHPESNVDSNRLSSYTKRASSSSSIDSDEYLGFKNKGKPNRPCTHTLTSICLVSRYQFFKKFEKCLRFLYVLIQKLHEGCKPRSCGRHTVWSVLTGAIESPELLTVRKSVEEIDIWILRLLSAPAPLAGRTSVHVYLQPPELVRPIAFALPDKYRFSLVDYSLHLPLLLLGVEKFLKVLFSLLFEQKVVLESSRHDRLTTCVLAFTALCYPLQYLFTVIPLLPSSLRGAEQLLQAPSPYIIGLPRSFRDSRLSFHLPKDVLLVDLDTQELYGQGAQDPIPKLPQNEEKKLIDQLNKVLAGLQGLEDESVDNVSKKSPARRSSFSGPISFESLTRRPNEESLNLAIRVSIVLFFKSPNVLGGFTEHTRTVRMYPRPVVAFQYERFMKSRPEPSPFTVVLAKTQAVEYFAEWSLMPDNLVYQRVDEEDLNPAEIGDRRFSNGLSIITFYLWTERFDRGCLRPVVDAIISSVQQSHLSPEESTNKRSETSATSSSDTLSDVSASNGDSRISTDSEPYSDFESEEGIIGKPQPSPTQDSDISDGGKGGRERGIKSTIFASVVLSTPERVECMQFGKELPPSLQTYYSPPASFVIPDLHPPVSAPTHSPARQDSLSNGPFMKEVIQRLGSTGSTIGSGRLQSQTFDSSERLRSFNTGLFTLRVPGADKSFSSRQVSVEQSQLPYPRSAKSSLSGIMDSWFNDSGRPSNAIAQAVTRKQRMESEISENLRFIGDCIATIQKGSLPGVFSRRRLQRLMEEELYRNSALVLADGHPVPQEQNHIADVILDSWDQYKAYHWLFNQVGVGVRQSCRPLVTTFIDSRGDVVSAAGLAQVFRDLFTSQTERNRVSRGGVCSAFRLLEMAHTYFYPLPKRGASGQQPRRGSHTPLTASAPISRKQSSVQMESNARLLNGGFQEELPNSGSGAAFNVINTQSPTVSQPFAVMEPKPKVDEEEIQLATSSGISMNMVEDVVLLAPFKSAVSLGYRYRHGRLFQMTSYAAQAMETQPPCISVSALRMNLDDQKFNSTGTAFVSGSQEKEEEESMKEKAEMRNLRPNELHSKIGHTYLFEEAMVNSTDSKLWTNMQFWEDLFLDTVARERELLGMDYHPADLLQHYSCLPAIGRKHLELGEDALLAGVMHNLIAFMVMARVSHDLIRRKARRLIAKSHTGLYYTQKITQLLNCLEWLRGNDIDLLPIGSRQVAPETFSVCLVQNEDPEVFTMEIYSDFLLVRSLNGNVLFRWWFDQIINVTHSPQRNVIGFQTRMNKRPGRFLFTANNPNSLFTSIASAINRARSRSQRGPIFEKLGGRLNVVDADTGSTGEIDLSPNGFHLTFGKESLLIPIDQVKRCRIVGEDIFSLSAVGHDNEDVVWNLKTDLAIILLNQWERLLGVAMVKNSISLISGAATPTSSVPRTHSISDLEGFNF